MESSPLPTRILSVRISRSPSPWARGEVKLDKTKRGIAGTTARATGPEPLAPYKEARARVLGEFEQQYLSALIKQCGGNASEAARFAGMDRQYLLGLLRRHGLR